jgi:spore coat protein CotF
MLGDPLNMKTAHNIRLTTAEMANLWTSYMSDSMAICVLKYFMEKVEDREIAPILTYSLELSQNHVQTIKEIFTHENFPIPQGFTNEDVNVTAPRLYSDPFYLIYLQNMSKIGLTAYSLAFPTMARSDVRDYYNECIASSVELNEKVTKVMLSKGIHTRPPYISTPDKVEYVHKQSFMTGWFGKRRTLEVMEITNIFNCLLNNIFGKVLLMGFGQVAASQAVRDYMFRGTNIASKHIEVLSSLLYESNLTIPPTRDSEVLNSTHSPFSDKLMMFHSRILGLTGMANYGTSIASSMRHDLSAQYARLSVEFGHYGDDGMNIMINEGWLEQSPVAGNPKELAIK